MTLSTKSFFFIFLLFLGTTILYAQGNTGRITGVVTDSTTGSPLFGANVWLRGTGWGAASDLHGTYLMNLVPEGTYTLVVRYIGYKEKVMSIHVTGGKTLGLNISLPPEYVQGQEVVVTAQARGQQAAINQQLTSNTIINVV